MKLDPRSILNVFDACFERGTFPTPFQAGLPAASRLTLHRSDDGWALVVEAFGYDPRSRESSLVVRTIADRLANRRRLDEYVDVAAWERYLDENRYHEVRHFHPLDVEPWWEGPGTDRGDENSEAPPHGPDLIPSNVQAVVLRGRRIPLPTADSYARLGIIPKHAAGIAPEELCRYLASTAREDVLATPEERRCSLVPEVRQILQVEEWYDPSVCDWEPPGYFETFRLIAQVLATGDPGLYRPSDSANSDWRRMEDPDGRFDW